MAMRLMDTKRDLSGGGSNYFKVGDGQTARVRFLYNKIDDVIYDGLLVHVLKPEVTGQRYNVEVLCNASSDETAKDECKWCKQEFSTVGRYPLALYNEGTKQVEYWSKSKSWVEKSLFTILENTVGEGQPISGQVYKIIRAGAGTDTQYTIIQDGANDGKTADQFGEVIQPPEKRNCYRPADFQFPQISNGGATFNANPNNYNGNYNQNPAYNQGQQFGNNPNYNAENNPNYNTGNNTNFQSTRRTTDVF